jgi:hypothetical protein
MIYDETIWQYAFYHKDDLQLMQQYISMFRPYQLFDRIGTYFNSCLVQVDDQDEGVNGFTKHLEYHPMMNGRAHALGPDNNIIN